MSQVESSVLKIVNFLIDWCQSMLCLFLLCPASQYKYSIQYDACFFHYFVSLALSALWWCMAELKMAPARSVHSHNFIWRQFGQIASIIFSFLATARLENREPIVLLYLLNSTLRSTDLAFWDRFLSDRSLLFNHPIQIRALYLCCCNFSQ